MPADRLLRIEPEPEPEAGEFADDWGEAEGDGGLRQATSL